MAEFGDLDAATRMRAAVQKIVAREVALLRPDIRIGRVYSYDDDAQTAKILFPGDDLDSLATVRYATDKKPSQGMIENFELFGMDAPANVVRIAGKPGSHFILDYVSGIPRTDADAGAGVYEPEIPLSTTSYYYRGDKTWALLNKAAVGLGNVDNTSDASKPISTATQTALNLKADDSAVVHKTGTETITGYKTFHNASADTVMEVSAAGHPTVKFLSGAWGPAQIRYAFGNFYFTEAALGLTGSNIYAGELYDHGQRAYSANNLVPWASGISGIPSTFTPSAHTHAPTDLTGGGSSTQYLRGDKTWQTLNPAAVGAAAASHTHAAADVNSGVFAEARLGTGTGTSAKYLRGDSTWQTHDKASVGLGNVDNTSDASKPISTATQTALNGKEPTLTAGTSAQYYRGDKTWQTLNPAAVGAAAASHTHAPTDLTGGGTTTTYLRGDKTWATLDIAAIPLLSGQLANKAGSNQYLVSIDSPGNAETAFWVDASTTGTKPAGLTNGTGWYSNRNQNLSNGGFQIVSEISNGRTWFRTYASGAWQAWKEITSLPGGGTTAHYFRGDSTWQTLNAAAAGAEPAYAAGTTAQYYRGDKTWQTLNPAAVGLGNVPNVNLLTAANSWTGTQLWTATSNTHLEVRRTDGGHPALYFNYPGNHSALLYMHGGNGAFMLRDAADAAYKALYAAAIYDNNSRVYSPNNLVPWASGISGIPGTFTPTAHTHAAADVNSGVFAEARLGSGTGTSAKYLRGDSTWQTHDKASVGLANVDNTSDASKPISTATQTALNGKEPTLTAGTTAQYYRGDKTWQTLNPAAVGAAAASHTHAPTDLTGGGLTTQYLRGDKSWQTLDKAAVGLSNVTNVAQEPALGSGTSSQFLRGDKVWALVDFSQVNSTLSLGQLPSGGTSAQYMRGDKTWQTLDKTAVGLSAVGNFLQAAAVHTHAQSDITNLVTDLAAKHPLSATKLRLVASATPSTPVAGEAHIFVGTNKIPYFQDDDGGLRALLTPIQAIHSNPGFEGPYSAVQNVGAVNVGNYPTGWSAFWTSDGTTGSQVASLTEGASAFNLALAAGAAAGRIQSGVYTVAPGDLIEFELDIKGTGATTTGMFYITFITSPASGDPNYFGGGAVFNTVAFAYTSSLQRAKASMVVPGNHTKLTFSLEMGVTGSAAGGLTMDNSASSKTTPVPSGVMTGEIKMWPTATAPSGYLLCNGGTHAVNDYPVLGALLGGSPGGNFTVPDMRGRVPVGAGSVTALLGNEGEANEALRSLNHSHTTPNHSHNVNGHWHTIPNHQHTISAESHSGNSNAPGGGTNPRVGSIAGQNSSGSHSHGGLTGNNGGGGATSTNGSSTDSTGASVTGATNLPRYGLNFIIKT